MKFILTYSMVLMLCPSWVEGRKGRSQPRLRTIVDDDEELCINDAESVRRRTRAGNGSKGSKVNQYEELYPPVSTTTPNEDILPTLDMIDIFQLGTFGSFPNGTLLGLLENDINYGAGGSCFQTTYEISVAEFAVATLKSLGAADLTTSIREYKLCDNQVYNMGPFNPPDFQICGAGNDGPIFALNPNLKLTCSGCVFQANTPADVASTIWTMIVTPSPAEATGFGLNYTPDGSGLILEGITFKRAPNSNAVSGPLFLLTQGGGYPVQLRDITVEGDPFVAGGLMQYLLSTDNPLGPVQMEISNMSVDGFAANVDIISMGYYYFTCPESPPPFSLSIEDSSFSNIFLDENADDLDISVGVVSLENTKIDLSISSTCFSGIFSPNQKAALISDKYLMAQKGARGKGRGKGKGSTVLPLSPTALCDTEVRDNENPDPVAAFC